MGLCQSGQQVSGGHVTMGAMSQWAAGQWWPCHYGGYVRVDSRSVVTMSLWGPCHSGQRVIGGHVTVGICHSVQQVSGGHVTVGAMSQWAEGQWWPCHYWGYVTVGSRSVVTM